MPRPQAPPVQIARWRAGDWRDDSDQVAAEEPLQLSLDGKPLSIVMRTPGNDLELALGLLWAEQVIRSLEFSVLAKYAFGLAQTFNAFYHRYPILNEERSDRKRWRAAGVAYVRAQLTRALDLMGIDVPARM